MTTKEWNPDNPAGDSNYTIDITFLKDIIKRMQQQKNDTIDTLLSNEECSTHQPIMTVKKALWLEKTTEFENKELLILLKFFTLAEVTYNGWKADEHSPVIGLAKALRQRGHNLDKALLTWIKDNNPNKFLPFGPLI